MTRMMMTTDTVGGVWTYSLQLARALAGSGVETVLVTVGPPPSTAQRQQLAASTIADVAIVESALEWMDDPWVSLERAGQRLLELEAQWRPDVVHLNGYTDASLPWAAPTLVVAHSDVRSWWRAVHHEPALASWDTYSRRVGAGLAAAGRVVAPTKAVADDLRREYGITDVTVIHNARGDDWVVEAAKEPFVLTAGRLWDPAKNVGALASISAELDWPVRIAGDTAAEAGAALDAAAGVEQLGLLPFHEVVTWMSRAAVYAAPARYEPFGLAVLEAALCRCALVLGDIPSLREVWGDAAIFVEPDDHDALASALRSLTDNSERREEMAARAHARAQRYHPGRMAASYGSLYESLVSVVEHAS